MWVWVWVWVWFVCEYVGVDLVYALCVEWDHLRAWMDNSIGLHVFVVVVNTGKSHVSDGELDRAIEQGRAAAMEIFNEVSVGVVRTVVGHINGRWEGGWQECM